jgi:hypothetical protein
MAPLLSQLLMLANDGPSIFKLATLKKDLFFMVYHFESWSKLI